MPLSFWIVHRAQLQQRLNALEQAILRRRIRREAHARLIRLWDAVTVSRYVH